MQNNFQGRHIRQINHHSTTESLANHSTEDIAREELQILFKSLLAGVPAGFVCATVVAYELYQVNHSELILYWYASISVISILRLGSFYFYQRNKHLYRMNLYIFKIGALLTAALWGTVASVLMPPGDLLRQMIVIVIVAGIGSGTSQAFQANEETSMLYLTLIAMPLTIWLFTQNSEAYTMLGIAMTAYLIFMLVAASRGYHLLHETLKFRYENLALIKNLYATNLQLEESNKSTEENKETLQNMLDNAPIGMGILSLEGKWLKVNQALSSIVGYTQAELENLTHGDLTFPGDIAANIAHEQKLKSSKQGAFQYEMRYVHKNGQPIWILRSISLVRNSRGIPMYFITQIQDITERKRDEKTMFELNERMQSMVTELQMREHDMAMISRMNDMLQACQNLFELYSIIELSGQDLFRNLSGGLAIRDTVTHQFTTVKEWGKKRNLKPNFALEDCWGLRESHPYFFTSSKKGLSCQHFILSPTGEALCLPLIVQSGVIGMIELQSQSAEDVITDYEQHLATTFSEVVRLALSNLMLRETLREQALHDPLTGLYNRRYLEETLSRELQRIKREKTTLCIAMLDLDHFKKFNDMYGHKAGDAALNSLSMLLKNSFRGGDVVCRFGGEEFILVLENTDLTRALPRLENIRKEVKNMHVFFESQSLPQITVSIGVAEAPKHGKTVDELIHTVDKALYQAKQTGRDRIVIVAPYETNPVETK